MDLKILMMESLNKCIEVVLKHKSTHVLKTATHKELQAQKICLAMLTLVKVQSRCLLRIK